MHALLAALLAAALVAVIVAGSPFPAPADASPHRLSSTREAGPDLSFVPGTASPVELDQVEALVGVTYASLVDVWAPVLGRPTDRNHHGTPEQRQAAWQRGLAGQECPIGAS